MVQPYVPGYRTEFFDQAEAILGRRGVVLEVLHGAPPPGHTARRDAAACACATQVPVARIAVPGGRHLNWRRVQRQAASADAVVVEQALHNLETYPLLLMHLLGRAAPTGPRVAFWGHGRTYTKPVSRIESLAKDALTRRGAWFFAYTESGAAHVASRGYPRDRITVVRNSVDTAALSAIVDRTRRPGTAEYAEALLLRERYGLVSGRTALFLGGLDAPKRIPLLLEAARRIASELPDFRLLVAGDGIDRSLVEEAASSPGSPVVAVGHATGRRTAMLGAVSDLMLMPGRVGLCAVDSFALRTPIVTTDWPWHAPEFEYLTDGRNSLVTPNDTASYTAAAIDLLNNPSRLERLRAGCARDCADYTVQGMASRFCEGLYRILGDGVRQ